MTNTQHAHGGSSVPSPPSPSLAERARTLLEMGGPSVLATLSEKHPGFPFASVTPYDADELGRPHLLISSMAMHTKNLTANSRCTLLVMQDVAADGALGAGRLSLIGNANRLAPEECQAELERYVARHPEAKQWAGYGDFSLYRIEPVEIYFVGGFGVMGWIRVEEFAAARPDPLAPFADQILEHMNSDHVDAMVRIALRSAGLEASRAAMTSIDRLGFQLRLHTAEGVRGVRINFPNEVGSVPEARAVLVQMAQQ